MDKEDKLQKEPMEFYNMSDFLRGQSSKLITGLSDEDKTALVREFVRISQTKKKSIFKTSSVLHSFSLLVTKQKD